jgi:arylsulfatase A
LSLFSNTYLMHLRTLIVALLLWGYLSTCSAPPPAAAEVPDGPPNIIIIFADDQGYGDVGVYGSTRIHTPNLDRMAMEGLKLTNFYAFPSCSPSRAALLTGAYPPRVGIPDVIGPEGPDWTSNKQYGINAVETTLPEMLKRAGYATGMIGKWHLGHFPETMPLRHGFDQFFGLPYSNDMHPGNNPLWPDLPLLDGEDTVALNPDQRELTSRYTQRAIEFLEEHQDTSFFLYLAHSMPHVPLFTSQDFQDRSGYGTYTDVIEEIDASVGQIFATLDQLGLDDNTIVLYTSDNGPWLTYGNHAGSAGPFREGKGTTYEGGMRVPFLARWPAGIPAGGVNHAPASLTDVLPTMAALTGAPLPKRAIDGRDLSLLLRENQAPASSPFYYYRSGNLDAVRLERWKLHIPHNFRYVDQVANDGNRGSYAYRYSELELYDLYGDPGEVYNVAEEFPEKVAELRALAESFHADMQREKREPFRPAR